MKRTFVAAGAALALPVGLLGALALPAMAAPAPAPGQRSGRHRATPPRPRCSPPCSATSA